MTCAPAPPARGMQEISVIKDQTLRQFRSICSRNSEADEGREGTRPVGLDRNRRLCFLPSNCFDPRERVPHAILAFPMLRVRFAPSPTGFLHIGSARTFLFNWLYARHNGGTMILRIDDTDAGRNTEVSLNSIFEGLRWLDLGWDEEYKQSERLALHRHMADAIF